MSRLYPVYCRSVTFNIQSAVTSLQLANPSICHPTSFGIRRTLVSCIQPGRDPAAGCYPTRWPHPQGWSYPAKWDAPGE